MTIKSGGKCFGDGSSALVQCRAVHLLRLLKYLVEHQVVFVLKMRDFCSKAESENKAVANNTRIYWSVMLRYQKLKGYFGNQKSCRMQLIPFRLTHCMSGCVVPDSSSLL